MKESPRNIGFVHKECASKPNPKFAKLPLESFIGSFAKLGFTGSAGDGGPPTLEHMWVEVLRVEGKELVGRLDNDPILEMEYVCGDEVAFSPGEIEQLLGPRGPKKGEGNARS